MSATAVHFSMIAMRAARFDRRMISVATNRDTFSIECVFSTAHVKQLQRKNFENGCYLIEPLSNKDNVRCPNGFVRLHPCLAQQLPGQKKISSDLSFPVIYVSNQNSLALDGDKDRVIQHRHLFSYLQGREGLDAFPAWGLEQNRSIDRLIKHLFLKTICHESH